MQEPITRHFNLKKDGAGHDLIDAVLRKPKPSKTILDNRAKMTAAGSEFKAFQDDDAKEKMKRRNEIWLRAAFLGDRHTMERIEKSFDMEAKSMVAAGTLSMMEYKLLTPQIEGTNSLGGYNAPPAYVGDLARNLAKYAICRNHFRMIGMKSWKENVPYLVTSPSVNVISENASITDSHLVEGNLLLTAGKAAALVAASNEMVEDANFPLWAAIQDTAWEQFGITEDTAGLQDLNSSGLGVGLLWYGDGALGGMNQITANGAIGVWRGGATNSGKTKFPIIGDAAGVADCWADWLYMLNAQPMGYYQGGKFFVDQNVAVAMFSLRDTQNRFIADVVNGITVEIGLEGQPKVFFKGYEIVIVPSGIMLNANTTAYTTSAVPSTPFTIFGNLERSWACMGLRGGFRVDMLREGTINSVSLAANDLMAMRLVERVAFGCALPNKLVILRTSAT